MQQRKAMPGEESSKETSEWRGWKLNDRRFVHFILNLICKRQQVVSCQWNSLDTLQETYIVLYKLFPPYNTRKSCTGFEGGGPNYWETNGSKWWESAQRKKQTNKYCGRKAVGYQSLSCPQLSDRFLAAAALTSKEGLVASSTAEHCMTGIRRVYLSATWDNLIEATNTICLP